MAYAIAITDLLNKDELKQASPSSTRLYKFSLSGEPDGLWVLLLQQAGYDYPEITLSANKDTDELWASADSDVSVKRILAVCKEAVQKANTNGNESQAQFDRAEQEREAALTTAHDTFVSEVDELDFDAP